MSDVVEFESLEERSLLLALDFTGSVDDVLSQPFRLKFETAGGDSGEHIPDFLAVFRDGSRWLLDVRPAGLVKGEDAVRFAAAGEAALEASTALAAWELDEETWRRLVASARARTEGRHLGKGPHDHVDRLAASVAIWQRVTCGFYRYAPLLKTSPGDWRGRGSRVTWKTMLGRGSSPVAIKLHQLLHVYADQLGRHIDAGEAPGFVPQMALMAQTTDMSSASATSAGAPRAGHRS